MTPVFRLSFLVALFAVAVVPAPAQTSRKPVFDSMYTKLAAGWTVDLRFAATQKEDEAAGRDTPRVHKGFGGYSFDEAYSAFGRHRAVVSANDSAFRLDLATAKPGLQLCGDTVEWRTASGKPFAVTARIEIYDGEPATTAAGLFTPAHRTGAYLIVRGLRGYERIKSDVSVMTPNANVRARAIADAGYRRGKK